MHPVSILTLVLAAVSLLSACAGTDPAGTTTTLPPWSNGQAAEAVLGAANTGLGGSSTAAATSITGPYQLTVDSAGTLFVVDQPSYRILRFDDAPHKANGAAADGILGQVNFSDSSWNANHGGSTPFPNGFNTAYSAWVDTGANLWVTDQANNRVMRFPGAALLGDGADAVAVLGQRSLIVNGFGTTISNFMDPVGVAADGAGNLYVAEKGNHRILRFANAAAKANGAAADGVLGQSTFTAGSPATTASGLRSPYAVAVDGAGNLFVADPGNYRVLVYKAAAAKAAGADADIVLGKPDFTDGAVPAGPSATTMYAPYAVAVDARGTLYVADGYWNRVLVFHDAANKGSGSPADAVLGKAAFDSPSTSAANPSNVGQCYGLAVHSASGSLFVADYGNSRVLRFKARSPLVP